MAAVRMEIESIKEYRLCMVDNTKRALFHEWESIEIAFGSETDACRGMRTAFGIVEYEDGTVDEVLPKRIRFIDEKMKNFCFRNNPS